MIQFVGIVVYYDGATVTDFDGMKLTFLKLEPRSSFAEALKDAKEVFDSMNSDRKPPLAFCERDGAMFYAASPVECHQ